MTGKKSSKTILVGARWILCALILLAMGLLTKPAIASSNRFYFASQYDWGSDRGFYVDVEDNSPDDTPCQLQSLKLILAVGDGKNWRFVSTVPKWTLGVSYRVKAVISPNSAGLWINDASVGQSVGGFVPAGGDLSVHDMPNWANGQADYILTEESFTIQSGAEKPLVMKFHTGQRPLPLVLFEPGIPAKHIPWKTASNQPLVIRIRFHINPVPGLKQCAPFIDRYGQCRYAHWPHKVHNNGDLKRGLQQEEQILHRWGMPPHTDPYGGDTASGWRLKATGFFRIVRRNGFFWLITPNGNPCFYRGVCSAPQLTWEATPITGREYLFQWLPPKTGPYAVAWGNGWGSEPGIHYLAFRTCNLIRKFGAADWQQKETQLTIQRLKVWGFSGDGKWDRIKGLPYVPVLGRAGVPILSRHPDIFDPAVRAKFRQVLASQISPHRNDPDVVGWSLGNEYDEIITTSEIQDILKMSGAVPAKRALVDYALQTIYHNDLPAMIKAWNLNAQTLDAVYNETINPPAADQEALRQYYADRYYHFIYKTVKSLDPNHLYFGFWIVPGWWQNQSDWDLIAKNCDVIGYDRYAMKFADPMFMKLVRSTDKPILCGEFSFPAWYDGLRGFGRYGVYATDDADSGRLYEKWTADAALNPYCVGICWFEYRNEPLTGRGPGHGPDLVYGEHYAFGVVDEADQPKWQLVDRMRKVNLIANALRLKATRTAGK